MSRMVGPLSARQELRRRLEAAQHPGIDARLALLFVTSEWRARQLLAALGGAR